MAKNTTNTKTSRMIHRSDGERVAKNARGAIRDGWTVPRGRDVTAVTRNASGQVIDRYAEALRKLQRH